jgi:ferredoxin-type protein NapH
MTRRQRVRRTLLLLSFIAFPVTMNYFSPYLIVDSSFRGIINGSFVVFASMFASSLLVGRLWCGWLCPAAGLQEPLLRVNDRRVHPRVDLVKWLVWAPWIGLIAFAAVRAGGYRGVDLLYGTVGGISVAGDADRPIVAAYAVYFLVVLLFFGLALGLGRRGGCHAVCWMAPFMIAGNAIRRRGGWPSLRLDSNRTACQACGTCASECPMGLNVRWMVEAGSMHNTECVLCGTCVDGCPHGAIRYSFD